jgi:hypothetical protein
MNLFEQIVMSILLAPLCLVIIMLLVAAIIWSPVLCVDFIFGALLLGISALFYMGFRILWD